MMVRLVVSAFLLLLLAHVDALAQYDEDSGPSGYPTDPPPPPGEEPDKKAPARTKPPGHLRVGGGVGVGFAGDLISIRVSPAVSYLFLNRVEPGATLIYEYRKDKTFLPHVSSQALGGSLFTRVYVFSGLFLEAEGLLQNVWTKGPVILPPGFYGNLLLGGGYVYFIGNTAFAGVSIKVNVNRNALYPTTRPFFSFGVGAQF